MPITAMCTRGTVVQRRPLPSFSTSTMEPVSATAKLQPDTPRSAAEEAGPQLLAGEGGEVLGLRVELAARRSASSCRMSRTWWRSRWTAGAMMWLGVWPASWMIHSPRSVSTTVARRRLERLVEAGLLRRHRLALHHGAGADRAGPRRRCRRWRRRRRRPSARGRRWRRSGRRSARGRRAGRRGRRGGCGGRRRAGRRRRRGWPAPRCGRRRSGTTAVASDARSRSSRVAAAVRSRSVRARRA